MIVQPVTVESGRDGRLQAVDPDGRVAGGGLLVEDEVGDLVQLPAGLVLGGG